MTDGWLPTAQTKAKSFWTFKPDCAEAWDRRSRTPSTASSTSPWRVVPARWLAVVEEAVQAPVQREDAVLNLYRRTSPELRHKPPRQPQLQGSAATRLLRQLRARRRPIRRS